MALDDFFVTVGGDVSGLKSAIADVSGALRKATGFIFSWKGAAVAGLAAVGVAAVQAGQQAVTAAAAVDAAFREVATLLPQVAERMGALKDQVIALSTQVPEPPAQLTQALYQAISAGARDTQEALRLVEVASKGATAGLTDTQTVVDAVTTILNAYQKDASEAAEVTDILFKTVEQGKVRFEELSQTIGKAVNSASLAGVSVEELGAAMATMTKFTGNARRSATALNRLFLSTTNVTAEQQAAIEELGIQFDTAAIKSKGLVGFLEQIEQATGGNVDRLAELIPSIREARAAFVLAGKGGQEFRDILRQMQRASGTTQEAFKDVNQGLEAQRQLLSNQINQFWAELGQGILPQVIEVYRRLNRLLETTRERQIRLLDEIGDRGESSILRMSKAVDQLNEQLSTNQERLDGLTSLASDTETLGDRVQQAVGVVASSLAMTQPALFGGPIEEFFQPVLDGLDAVEGAVPQEELNQLDDTLRFLGGRGRPLAVAAERAEAAQERIELLRAENDLTEEQENSLLEVQSRLAENIAIRQDILRTEIKRANLTDPIIRANQRQISFFEEQLEQLERFPDANAERIQQIRTRLEELRDENTIREARNELEERLQELTTANRREINQSADEQEAVNDIIDNIISRQRAGKDINEEQLIILQAMADAYQRIENAQLNVNQQGNANISWLRQVRNELESLQAASAGQFEIGQRRIKQLELQEKVLLAQREIKETELKLEDKLQEGDQIRAQLLRERLDLLRQAKVELSEQLRQMRRMNELEEAGGSETVESVEPANLRSFLQRSLPGDVQGLGFVQDLPFDQLSELRTTLSGILPLLLEYQRLQASVTLAIQNYGRESEQVTQAEQARKNFLENQLQPALQDTTKALKADGFSEEEITNIYEAFGVSGDGGQKNQKNMRDTIRDIGRMGTALVDLAANMGLVDDEAKQLIQGITQLGTAAAQFATGNIAAGVASGISGLSGLVGGLFGGDEEERRMREREEEDRIALRNALQELRQSVEKLRQVFEETAGEIIAAVKDLFKGLSTEGTDEEVIARFREGLRASEATAEDVVTLLEQSEGDFTELIALVEGEFNQLREKGEASFRGVRDEIEAAQKVIDELDISEAFDDFQGQLDMLRREFDLFDIDAPIEQLRRMRELFLEFVDLPGNLEEQIAGFDLSDPEQRKQFESLLQQLFTQIQSGELGEGAFGELTLQQFLEQISKQENLLDQIEENTGEGADGEAQDVSVDRSITEVTGRRIVSIGTTQIFWLEQIAHNTAKAVGLQPPTQAQIEQGMGQDQPTQQSFDIDFGNIEINVEADDQTTAQDLVDELTTELLPLLDQRLRDRLQDRLRSTGQTNSQNLLN